MPIMDWWKARHGAVEDVGGHTCLAPPPRKGKAWAVENVGSPHPNAKERQFMGDGRCGWSRLPPSFSRKDKANVVEDVGGNTCPHLFPGKARQGPCKMWMVKAGAEEDVGGTTLLCLSTTRHRQLGTARIFEYLVARRALSNGMLSWQNL